jgi:tetratricopeptide (TPR) repeat protein
MEWWMQVQADDLYKKGMECLVEGKDLKQAEEIFNCLLNDSITRDINPDKILFSVGSVEMKKGNHALALIIFREVLKHSDDFIEAHNNIGYIYKKEQLIDEAKSYFEKTLELTRKPEYIEFCKKDEENYKKYKTNEADYLTNVGSLLIANGTPVEAIKCFDEALTFNNNCTNARWNRSLAYLELGDYERGFAEYDIGDRTERCKNRNYTKEETPFWDGTPGKTVVIYGEQGIGDEIMFASILPDVMKDCHVILDAHPRLADLFRYNFPNIAVYGTRKSKFLPWANFHKADAKIAIGSLGKFYRKKKEDFPGTPYLKANSLLVEKYQAKLNAMGDKPKIGISWMGGSKDTGKSNRFIPLDFWKDILSLDADFISLQYTKDIDDDVKQFEESNNLCINHWRDVIDDYDETAGLVANLDLIISVPQSVVHLAGALGTPTWQLVPFKAMWQMGPNGENMPWYDYVKNIWQDNTCDWLPVMEKVKKDLCNLLQKNIDA